MPTYDVTCTLANPEHSTPGDAIDRLLETTSRMREEGVRIDHRYSTISERPDGDVPQIDIRFRASTEGVVGWHLCRARLPAGGIRRVE